MHQVNVAQFQGPLDLLLQLIEEEKLDITQLSLASVTEQYLQALQHIGDQLAANDLADFLVVAARLLLIKSRTLLPYLQAPQDDEGRALEQQLKLYREYYLAAQHVHAILRRRQISFSRERLLQHVQPTGFFAPPNLTVTRLTQVFVEVIAALPPMLPTHRPLAGNVISIQQKILELRDVVWREQRVRFSQLLGLAGDRTEVIVSFLAILELTKQRHVRVQQDALFQEIVIERVRHAP